MSHKYQASYDAGTSYYQVPGGSQLRLNDNYPPNQTFAAGAKASHNRNKWYQNPWVKYGVPALLVVAIAGGVGGGFAASRSNEDNTVLSANRGVANNAAAGPIPSNSNGNPVYSSTAAASPPAATATSLAALCSADNPSYSVQVGNYQVRPDHPRLFASSSKWSCLPQQIAQDDYLSSWNATIFGNATRYAGMTPVNYTIDGGLGGSGVLDPARELQLRIKHWAYAYRLTNDSMWVNRTWQELLVSSGNSSQYFGEPGTRWNPVHFLDLAEFTAAFAFAYDWMYDAWTDDQRNAIMWSIINLGLSFGINTYTQDTGYGWWRTTNGNWNCVCNNGLTMGALAIAGDDPTGSAAEILGYTIPNAQANCAQAVQPDGTWSETSDYWYFGSTAAAEMGSCLRSATGTTQDLFSGNPNYNKTGLFHMYGTGFTYKFDYGDCGPNKYTATANSLMFFGDIFNNSLYTLYQRDRSDAPEPLAMFYYNPDVSGDWWYNLPIDHHFDSPNDDWVAMRSSWTDSNALYAAMKAGNNSGHQNHNDLDAGDFVFDALGQRWAGQLCQDNYLNPGYFVGDIQDYDRWTYYRCMTQGQNTILMDNLSQNLDAAPPTTYDTTGDEQSSLDYTVASNSAVYWTADMSAAYNSTVKRGMRLLNARRQILIQDEIQSEQTSEWRMHTNATISLSNGDRTATLALGGETLIANILDSAPALTFGTSPAVRLAGSGSPPDGYHDLPNPGVTVLTIAIPTGSTTLEVLFNPQWSGMSASDYKTPSSVALSSWSLTSHN